jgi:hypothetical protein
MAYPGSTAPRGSRERRGLLRYALAWLVSAAAVATAIVILSGSTSSSSEDAALPPIGQIQLERAATVARCELVRGDPTTRSNPAAEGRASPVPPRPRVYTSPLRPDDVVAAGRRGIVVVQYRPTLDADVIDMIAALQSALPNGTVVAPNGTGMRYAVAVTAWRRMLGCKRVTGTAIEAVRLFRGRFIGSGPGP